MKLKYISYVYKLFVFIFGVFMNNTYLSIYLYIAIYYPISLSLSGHDQKHGMILDI